MILMIKISLLGVYLNYSYFSEIKSINLAVREESRKFSYPKLYHRKRLIIKIIFSYHQNLFLNNELFLNNTVIHFDLPNHKNGFYLVTG